MTDDAHARQGRFGIVPAVLFEDDRLSPTHIALIAALSTFEGPTGWVWPRQELLARMVGLDQSNVSRALQQLHEWGVLQRRPWKGRQYQYRVIYDRDSQAAPETPPEPQPEPDPQYAPTHIQYAPTHIRYAPAHTEQEKEQEKEQTPPGGAAKRSARKLHEGDWSVTPELRSRVERLRPDLDLDRFEPFFRAKQGDVRRTERGWNQCFLNWAAGEHKRAFLKAAQPARRTYGAGFLAAAQLYAGQGG